MFVQPLLCASKGIPHAKYEKNLLLMPVSLLFFCNIGPNSVQILNQDHTYLFIFCVFQWNTLVDSINIDNFNWNPIVLKKKMVKPIKLSFLSAQLPQKRGHYGSRPKQKTISFTKITKLHHKLSEIFNFIKMSYVFAVL